MDMDVECYQSTASFLRGFNVVLNVELGNNFTITNAVMASTPNATLWRHVFMMLRVNAALATFLFWCVRWQACTCDAFRSLPLSGLQPQSGHNLG